MPWNTPTEADVINRLTPAELAALKNIQGAIDLIPLLLADRVASAQGNINAGGFPLGPAGTIPDQIKTEVLAQVRWDLLVAFPGLEKLRTPDRKDAAANAEKKLDAISRQEIRVESPTPPINPVTGQWNSENKLIMRTHPTPDPATQFQTDSSTAPPYANPNAPADT